MQAGYGYQLAKAGDALERCDLEMTAGPDEVVVKVAGCGVCHTDVGFAYDGVPTRHPLPLVLGHVIAGKVVETGENVARWMGKSVIVPAVIPCGQCPACRAGRPTICSKQFMPGNDGHGGFATHVRVPARGLCVVPELPKGVSLESLSVVADAVTTPYEAIRRSGLGADDVAVFVGVGGVGGFGVQIAAALGAAVFAIDVDQGKLELAAAHGAHGTFQLNGSNEKELKPAVKAFAKQSGRKGIGLKVFETSGTTGGQQTAFGLLDFGGYLSVVGYTAKKVELRLSNLMALDATARGNWGCPPEQYPAALQLVLDGKVTVADYVEPHALDEAPQVLEAVARHALKRRVILHPNGDRS
jgi:6-hydroxycyclohex-1-ene-1-carbonyl-CoA dehydrogenase